jgi:hypothetical protein
MNDSSKYVDCGKVVPFSYMFFYRMTFYEPFCRKKNNFPANMHWNPPMEGNDPILRATLVVKLHYLPYFLNNFQTDYTGESGIERG